MSEDRNNNQLPPISGPQPEENSTPSAAPPRLEGYDVVGPLGEGGMGTVWRAIQLSTCREVALKLMGKRGAGSEKDRARFEREVELTARLQHPNIAGIYDSGVQNGVYYYAMELIEGVDLDRYVQEHSLSRREILELMRSVCEAVQHAHQRGIIHRDLKPSNILVTPDSQPHVLDFGVGKAILTEESDLRVSTDGDAAGTPSYMSPEQAAGHLEQIDTRTDVYALGVILFRLLAGDSPHDLSGTRHEVLCRIAGGKVRCPREVNRSLDRELEALLLKALAHDPKDRYLSAGALAQDIENYLNGEPLDAKRPSTTYFLWKRIKKYRFQVAAASAVLSILLGTAVFAYARIAGERAKAVHQRSVAQLARDEARTEAAKAKATYQSLQNMLTRIDTPMPWGEEILLRESSEDSVEATRRKALDEETLTELRDQPKNEAAIRMTVGRLYLAVGEFDAAEAQFSRAFGIRRQVLDYDHPETLKSMVNLAVALSKKGELVGLAEGLLRRAIEIQRRVLGEEHPDTLAAMNNLGILLRKWQKVDEAEKVLRDCLDIERRTMGEQHVNTLNSMVSLASVLAENDKLEEAEKTLLDCWRTQCNKPSDPHEYILDSSRILRNLAGVLRAKGELDRAESVLERSMSDFRFVVGEEHRDAVRAKMTLALTLLENGKLDKAKETLTECVEVSRPHISHLGSSLRFRGAAYWLPKAVVDSSEEEVKRLQEWVEWHGRVMGKEHPGKLWAVMLLGLAQLGNGEPDEAEETWRDCLETQRVVLGEENRYTLCSMMNMAVTLERKGELPQAEQMLEDILESCRRPLEEGRCDVLDSMIGMANNFAEVRLLDEAEARQRHILTICRTLLGEQHAKTIEVTGDLAITLSRKGCYDEAEQMLRQSLEVRQRLAGEEDQGTLSFLAKLGIVLQQRGNLDEAAQTLKRYLDIQLKVLAETKPDEVFVYRRGYPFREFRELGLVLERMPDVLGEEEGARQVLEFWRRLLGEEHGRTIEAMRGLARTLEKAGKLEEAEDLLRRSSVGDLAELFKKHGKLAEAEATFRQLLAGNERRRDYGTFWAMKNLAEVLEEKGEVVEAEAMLRKRADIARDALTGDEEIVWMMQDIASFLERRQKLGEAEPILRERLRLCEKTNGDEDPNTLKAINALASVLWRTGKLDEVEALNRRNLEIRQGSQGREHPDTLWAMSTLALVLGEEGKIEEANALTREYLEIWPQPTEKEGDEAKPSSEPGMATTEYTAASDLLPTELVTKAGDSVGAAATVQDDGALLVRDDFDGKLTLDWKILKPDPTHISLTKNPGTLTIRTQEGDLWQSGDTYENLLLVDHVGASQRDFELTTCTSSFTPVADWNQAGLICHSDNGNYLKFMYEHNSRFSGPVLTVVAETAGRANGISFPPPPGVDRLWLRLTKKGKCYTFSACVDGNTFSPVSHGLQESTALYQWALVWGDGTVEHVGIFAMNGGDSAAPEVDASFDFFEVRSIPSEK